MTSYNSGNQVKQTTFLENVRRNGFAYTRQGIRLVAALTLLGIAFWGYRYYVVSREKAAYKIFAQCTYEFNKAQQGLTPWQEVATMFEQGYSQHKNAHLAPYFLLYQAQALFADEKANEAREVMQNALVALPKSSPVYYLYATKDTLMRLDADGQDGDALQALQALAYDDSNSSRDMALYFLGQYYWSVDDMAKAQKTWEDLVAFDDDSSAPSQWAALVEQEVKQLAGTQV